MGRRSCSQGLTTSAGIEINGTEIFPSASTFKVAVLYELFRQVDKGRINLKHRIEIEEEHLAPGAGIINFFDAGLQLSIKDLATLMIILSDNTATDIVMDVVGKNVNRLLRDLRLIKTSFPKNTKELLADASDIDLTKVKGKAILELFREKLKKGK
ncbi:MAG: serine hydrolase [Candidatus Baldrarchaeia archaeon]